ncbi:MAG: PaaI family thioesterase [Melioribacteraceae bacterium]|nr:PaaI family thioesterase [Melioribacteraceae bacterium]
MLNNLDKNKLKPLPEHGSCFVCGSQNPKSIGVKWYYSENNEIYCDTVLTAEQQGPPEHAHGGASAALLDEAMGFAAWVTGYKIVSANLNINFLKPVPLGVPLKIHAKVVSKKGKKILAKGEITLDDGTIAVEGKSLLIEPNGFFKNIDDKYNNFMENK